MDLGTTINRVRVPQVAFTLWHCSQCNTFVSIRSERKIDDPFCPACGMSCLDYCGANSCLPEFIFAEA